MRSKLKALLCIISAWENRSLKDDLVVEEILSCLTVSFSEMAPWIIIRFPLKGASRQRHEKGSVLALIIEANMLFSLFFFFFNSSGHSCDLEISLFVHRDVSVPKFLLIQLSAQRVPLQ